MVHKAFREILGETATQAGSENAPGRFRFDFPSSGAVSEGVLNDVEARVNSLLLENLLVSAEEMSQAEVISVGDWAKELCGGTHVSRSGELGIVKLLGESSIGAGVRRVEALVGADAYSFLSREHILINSLLEIIKATRPEELPERISALLARLKEAEKEIGSIRTAKALSDSAALVKNAENIGQFKLISADMGKGLSGDDLRTVALDLRNRLKGAVVALLSSGDEKVTLVVATDETARSAGAKAGALVKIASGILGGGGGGKDDFAQGGGSDFGKIDEALKAIKAALSSI